MHGWTEPWDTLGFLEQGLVSAMLWWFFFFFFWPTISSKPCCTEAVKLWELLANSHKMRREGNSSRGETGTVPDCMTLLKEAVGPASPPAWAQQCAVTMRCLAAALVLPCLCGVLAPHLNWYKVSCWSSLASWVSKCSFSIHCGCWCQAAELQTRL